MDRIIEIKVNGSYLTKDNRIGGVQHEANATNLRIEFDAGWDGYAKKVTFWDANGQNPVERTLTADLLEDITVSTRIYLCPIPGEALAESGECTFVIDGYISGKRQRSISDTLMVREAPFIEQAEQPVDPTPTQAEQLQVQIDTMLEDMAEQATIAANKADDASISELNAKAYANGGLEYTKSESGVVSGTFVVGAKDYADQAKAYAEGGLFDPNPNDGVVQTVKSDGAKNMADKARAFAESGTYKEYEVSTTSPGSITLVTKTVSKGAKQYAEDAANSASAAADSKAAASDSASSAESFATAAEQSVASARSAASQAHSEASYASEQKSQAQSAASNADKFATQARQHMEQSREYYQQAGTSANNAAQSAASASTSEANAKASETAAKASETTAKSEADRAKSEADRAAGIVGGDYATKTELAAHTDDADIHVTAEEKTAWSGKQEAVERFSVSTSSTSWDTDTMSQTVEEDIFIKSGYIYLVYFSTSNNDLYERYVDCGIYAQRVMTDGKMIFKARKIPMDDFSITVVRISSVNGSGQVINSSSFWADVEDLSKDEHKALINSSFSIPNGRMVGDVDGDGEIANFDRNLIMKMSAGLFTPTDIQRQCADLDGDGLISSSDALVAGYIVNGRDKLGKYSSDVLGNWTVNPNYATEDAQFYTDIPVSGMTAGQDISIIIGGGKESAKIVKVEAIDGAMRVWATSLPIEALPYKFVQDGPKTVSVTLAAASWDSTAKTQTVTVTGVKASETAQMITPTPALASQTAYYEAGILCTGQAADSLTFTCKTVPTTDLTVYVVMEELVSG